MTPTDIHLKIINNFSCNDDDEKHFTELVTRNIVTECSMIR